MADKVPPEVLERIFMHVSNPYDLFTLRLICCQWHGLITNERFLNLYFDKRLGPRIGQKLEWVNLRWIWMYLPHLNHRSLYRAPANLQGSGSVEISSRDPGYKARLLSPMSSLTDYSVGMWLNISTAFASITFSMRSNDFSLEFIIKRRCIQARCSHMGGLWVRACTRVSFRHWIYIVLTYASSASNFIFWINGEKYPLVPIQGPLSENQMGTPLVHEDFDGYLRLRYEDNITNIKFFSTVSIADVQVLPCNLTRHEIRAIVEQSGSIDKLNMGRYILEHWANLRWYSKYLFRRCIFL